MKLPGKMILLQGNNLEVIQEELNERVENTVIFFLPNNQYGYGYTYKESTFTSNSLEDRFSEEEMLENIDELIGEENRTAYIEEHNTHFKAVTEVINFYCGMDIGYYNSSLTIEEAIQFGRWLNLDYIII